MNQDKLRKHKDEAARQLAKGRVKEALDELLQIQKLDPHDLANRQKVGDLQRKLGNNADAIKAYQEVSGAYAADGLLLKAIAGCKIILQIDAHHTETQKTLADLYGKKRGDVGAVEMPQAMSAAIAKAAPGQKLSASMIRGIPATQLPLKQKTDGDAAARTATGVPPPGPTLPLGDGGPPRTPTGVPPQPPRVPTGLPPPIPAAAAPLRVPTGMPPPPPPQDASVEIELDVSDATPEVVGQEIPADAPPRVTPHAYPSVPPVAPAASWGAAPAPAPVPMEVEVPVVHAAGPADLEEIEMPGAPPAAPASLSRGAGQEVGGAEEFADFLIEDTAVPQRVDVEKLPPIPLFSDLSKNAFIDLMERMDIRVVNTGETIIQEGEVGNSFFIIVSGRVRIEKTVEGKVIQLATLEDGAFFGEIALLSDAPRTASVVAETDGELFEISRGVLDAVIKDYPSVQQVMLKFYKQRLLSNLLNTSPIFSKFDKTQRKQLIEMFRSREVQPGEDVLTEGQKGDGLYVVLSGRVKVVKGGKDVAVLKEGDVFGEMSLLTRDPVSASIRSMGRTMVLRLPRKQFNEVIMTHPQVLEMVSELSARRARPSNVS